MKYEHEQVHEALLQSQVCAASSSVKASLASADMK